MFSSALIRALPSGVLAYQAWKIKKHVYGLLKLEKGWKNPKLPFPSKKNLTPLQCFTMEHSLKKLELWKSWLAYGETEMKSEILRSLENIIITGSTAIACLNRVSLTGILSWSICVAIVMEMLDFQDQPYFWGIQLLSKLPLVWNLATDNACTSCVSANWFGQFLFQWESLRSKPNPKH